MKRRDVSLNVFDYFAFKMCRRNFVQRDKVSTEAIVRMCSVRKDVLRNFVKFTGKHLCQSLFYFLIKFQASVCNFIKKETLAEVFPCEFYEISTNTCSYKTPPVAAFVSTYISANLLKISWRSLMHLR